MSKIGKLPIEIPNDVKVEIKEKKILVKGPKGALEKEFPSEIFIERKDNLLFVKFQGTKEKKALWGTWRALIKNIIKGVNEGYEKKLKMTGVGWKANIEGDNLILKTRFTHPVKIPFLKGINLSVEKDIINVSGIDKEKVGLMTAKIRAISPPEPYKGKGIAYLDEVIKRKAGKKVVAAK